MEQLHQQLSWYHFQMTLMSYLDAKLKEIASAGGFKGKL